MNSELFRALLRESESDSLDFKRNQYLFESATDEKKGELLKDILAFTNSWRRTDAYILIGINEVSLGENIVVGVKSHLKDSNIQQFVNSKVNRPITFAYKEFEYNGKQIGIIHIPVQKRPFYLTKRFGKLEVGTVYLRRGSATEQANPDEVADMGASTISVKETREPKLKISFGNKQSGKIFGNKIDLNYKLPDLKKINGASIRAISPKATEQFYRPIGQAYPNPKFYLDFAKYLYSLRAWVPAQFIIQNSGNEVAKDVTLRIVEKRFPSISFGTVSVFEKEPKYMISEFPDWNFKSVGGGVAAMLNDSQGDVIVEEFPNRWEISCNFGSIQPKAESWSDLFYVSFKKSQSSELNTEIYADNLTKPHLTKLELIGICEWEELTLDNFQEMASKFIPPN